MYVNDTINICGNEIVLVCNLEKTWKRRHCKFDFTSKFFKENVGLQKDQNHRMILQKHHLATDKHIITSTALVSMWNMYISFKTLSVQYIVVENCQRWKMKILLLNVMSIELEIWVQKILSTKFSSRFLFFRKVRSQKRILCTNLKVWVSGILWLNILGEQMLFHELPSLC